MNRRNYTKSFAKTFRVLQRWKQEGSDAYNQGLSERRANAAAGYLRANGIAYSRVKTKGMGETDPKAGNDTDAGRAENRRVEFVITANQKMIDDAKKESAQ